MTVRHPDTPIDEGIPMQPWAKNPSKRTRVGYVLKMYPRFSETFIVNEILAHEAAGLDIEIFSLRAPVDGRFHESLARVRAPVHYLPAAEPRGNALWGEIRECADELGGVWGNLETALREDARDVYQALLLARAAKERGITHLHAHFGTVSTTVARIAGRLADLPYSFTAHAKDIFHESVSPDDLRAKLAEAAAVVTVSNYNESFLRETYGKAAGTVRRIYNGLDLDQFDYAAPEQRAATVVSVGRLVEKKGFEDLIDACAVMAERGRDVRCLIVGSGPLEDRLRAQIRGLGLENRVEMLGPRPQGEVKRIVQEAAVFAAPCVVGTDGNRDGLPTVLLEAMALGTPCVSTDVTGIPEVLRDGDTGVMVPQRAPRPLADAIQQLIDDASLRVRLAANARKLMEAEFDIHRNAARIREVFVPA